MVRNHWISICLLAAFLTISFTLLKENRGASNRIDRQLFQRSSWIGGPGAEAYAGSEAASDQSQAAKEYFAPFLQRDEQVQKLLRAQLERRERNRQILHPFHLRARSAADPIKVFSAAGPMFWDSLYGKDYDVENCSVPCRFLSDPKDEAARNASEVILHFFNVATFRDENFTWLDGSWQKLGFLTTEPSWNMWLDEGLETALNKSDIVISHSQFSDVSINEALHFHDHRHVEAEHPVPPLPLDFVANHSLLATFISDCTPAAAKDSNPEDFANVTCLSCKSAARERFVVDMHAQGATFDHFGRCQFQGNIRPLPNSTLEDNYFSPLNSARKMQLLRAYKFVLAMENTIMTDYVTEKFYQGFATGRVPVYLGAPNAAKWALPGRKSFINAIDYSPAELVALLERLDADDSAYQEYVVPWEVTKEHFYGLRKHAFAVQGKHDVICRICEHYRMYYDTRPDSSRRSLARKSWHSRI